MAYSISFMSSASLPPLHSLGRWRGTHCACAALALGLALLQASSLGLASHGGAALPPKARLVHYVTWIDKALQLTAAADGHDVGKSGDGPGHRGPIQVYARYYAWSKAYPGDVRVVLLRDPARAGVHVVDVDDIPRSAEGVCDLAARVDMVRRRVMEIGCNPGA